MSENDSSILPKRAVEAWNPGTFHVRPQRLSNGRSICPQKDTMLPAPPSDSPPQQQGTRQAQARAAPASALRPQDRKIHMPFDTSGRMSCIRLHNQPRYRAAPLNMHEPGQQSYAVTEHPAPCCSPPYAGERAQSLKQGAQGTVPVGEIKCVSDSHSCLHLVSKKVIDSGNSLEMYFKAASQGTCLMHKSGAVLSHLQAPAQNESFFQMLLPMQHRCLMPARHQKGSRSLGFRPV